MKSLSLFSGPTISREDLNSYSLSLVPIDGDHMAPTLRGGLDYVLVAPCDEFSGDSLYVIEDEAGQPIVWHCQSSISGIRLRGHNPAYDSEPGIDVPRGWFNARVLGRVVADIKVREPELIRSVATG